MYENFYKLRERPFSLLPDPDYLYLSKKHQTALSLLEYSLLNQAGFCVISGETGAGKTTLIRRVLGQLGEEISVGLITNTHRHFGELLRWVLMAFGLDHTSKDRIQLYETFLNFLIEQYAQNRHTVLVVDEAQNMSPETLEELRMLSNVNADKDQVIQVILVGQPGLRDTLRRNDLEQFAQRIAVDYHLEPLDTEETCSYIRHRLQVAGGSDKIFDAAACERVFQYSGGTPRLINLLCDTALVYGYAEQVSTIKARLIDEVVRDRQAKGALPRFEPLASAARTSAGSTASSAEPESEGPSALSVTVEDKLESLASRSVNAVEQRRSETVRGELGESKQSRPTLTVLKNANVQAVAGARGIHGVVVTSMSADPNQDAPEAGKDWPESHTGQADELDLAAGRAGVSSHTSRTMPDSMSRPSDAPSPDADADAVLQRLDSLKSSLLTKSSGSEAGDTSEIETSPIARLASLYASPGKNDELRARLAGARNSSLSGLGRRSERHTDAVDSDDDFIASMDSDDALVEARKPGRGLLWASLGFAGGMMIAAVVIAILVFNGFGINSVVAKLPIPGILSDHSELSVSSSATGALTPVPEPMTPPNAGATPADAPNPGEDRASVESARASALQRERDAAVAEIRALERERDAALAAARARERAETAEYAAAQARERERAAALEAAKAQERVRAAELAAAEARERERAAAIEAAKAMDRERAPEIKALKAGEEAAPPAPAGDLGPGSSTVPLPITTPAPLVDNSPKASLKFTANPCRGPSAKFLSTCKE